jgi:plasmid stability protein
MKTTLDLPDELLRQLKAAAALRGQSMKDFVAEALSQALAGPERRPASAAYVAELRSFARRVSKASTGRLTASEELRKMRDRF